MELDCDVCWQGYRVYQGGQTPATTVWRPVTVNARQTQTIVSDLSPGNTYQFQLSAFTSVGAGPLSDPVQVILRSTGASLKRLFLLTCFIRNTLICKALSTDLRNRSFCAVGRSLVGATID